MSEEFELKAVKCKSCGSGLTVELNDEITYCLSCGSGFEIIDGDLHPIEINFIPPAYRDEGETVYKPFWILDADVSILERESSGGFFASIFGGNQDTGNGSIRFYIPAFPCRLDSMQNIAKTFTIKNPASSPQKYNVKLTGFTYDREDAKKIAEFVLISLEADKSDTIKTFRYDIKFKNEHILGVPFYKYPDGTMKDAVLGIQI